MSARLQLLETLFLDMYCIGYIAIHCEIEAPSIPPPLGWRVDYCGPGDDTCGVVTRCRRLLHTLTLLLGGHTLYHLRCHLRLLHTYPHPLYLLRYIKDYNPP